MSVRAKKTLNVVLCATALLVGCQSAVDEPVMNQTPIEATSATASAQPAVAAAKPSNAEATDPPASTAQVAGKEFTPPFPDRTELFEPPRRAQSTVRRDDESGNTVELKGFVNVDGHRAILSIDGVIAPVAVGDEKYGVQVISIDAPSVVLQRGRSRWTATLD